MSMAATPVLLLLRERGAAALVAPSYSNVFHAHRVYSTPVTVTSRQHVTAAGRRPTPPPSRSRHINVNGLKGSNVTLEMNSAGGFVAGGWSVRGGVMVAGRQGMVWRWVRSLHYRPRHLYTE